MLTILADDPPSGGPTPPATRSVSIRLDGRSEQLLKPRPGSAEQHWNRKVIYYSNLHLPSSRICRDGHPPYRVSTSTQVMGTAALLSGRGRITLGCTNVMELPESRTAFMGFPSMWLDHSWAPLGTERCIMHPCSQTCSDSRGKWPGGHGFMYKLVGRRTGHEVPSSGHRSTFTLQGKRGFSQFHSLHKLSEDGRVVHTHGSPVEPGQHVEQAIYHNTLRDLHSGGLAREQL